MQRKSLFKFVVCAAVITSMSSCGSDDPKGKVGFMENARVFESFEMKKDYDKRIEKDMFSEAKLLDSLELQLGQVMQLGDSLKSYQLRRQHFVAEQQYNQKFQEKSTRYTQEVNDRLNVFIEKYSEKNGYDFILGSNGQGNVMYAIKDKNITEDLITFINSEYNNK